MTQYGISKQLQKQVYKELRIKLHRFDAAVITDTVMGIIRQSLLNGEKVILPNLLTLTPYTSTPHSHYNINTREIRMVPGKRKIKCKVSKHFSDELNCVNRSCR